MDEAAVKMMELHQKGLYCGQIMVGMGLHNLGRSDPEMVRAMEVLKGGLSFAGHNCGALTGAAIMLGLFAGKEKKQEEENPLLDKMVHELVDWFQDKIGSKYGGVDCLNITGGRHDEKTKETCQVVVYTTYKQAESILKANGFL
jgi:C_GCAxxG_C_C family probable redox protein